jgi:hypothetical protein
MTVIHANDPTTKVLSYLYEQRQDISARITEASTNGDIQRAIRGDDTIMMLGHGNQYGLFSKPDMNGEYKRFLITDRHVQFLRNKTCIGIWCHANKFAERYGLHGLFSGMIISELQEAIDYNIPTTKEKIDAEMEKFTCRLKGCIDRFGLAETSKRMSGLDDVKSELTIFNYNNLYYYE